MSTGMVNCYRNKTINNNKSRHKSHLNPTSKKDAAASFFDVGLEGGGGYSMIALWGGMGFLLLKGLTHPENAVERGIRLKLLPHLGLRKISPYLLVRLRFFASQSGAKS